MIFCSRHEKGIHAQHFSRILYWSEQIVRDLLYAFLAKKILSVAQKPRRTICGE